MKPKLVLLLALWAALVLSGCSGEGMYSGSLVTRGNHRIESGDVVAGELLVLNGEIVIEEGAQVTGSIYQLGGTVQADGEIGRDLDILGGSLSLGPHARVAGNLNEGGGKVERSPEATISGKERTSADLPEVLPLWSQQSLGDRLLQSVYRALLMAVLAFLAVHLVGNPVARVTQAAVGFPVAAGSLGMLAGIVGLVLLVFMAFTIILIPMSALVLLMLAAASAYGLLALGSAFGRRLASVLRWDAPPALAAALGTLLLVLLSDACAFFPVVGALVSISIVSVGLGAVLLTRFGAQGFVPEMDRSEMS
jgi:hypothetical protein